MGDEGKLVMFYIVLNFWWMVEKVLFEVVIINCGFNLLIWILVEFLGSDGWIYLRFCLLLFGDLVESIGLLELEVEDFIEFEMFQDVSYREQDDNRFFNLKGVRLLFEYVFKMFIQLLEFELEEVNYWLEVDEGYLDVWEVFNQVVEVYCRGGFICLVCNWGMVVFLIRWVEFKVFVVMKLDRELFIFFLKVGCLWKCVFVCQLRFQKIFR